MNISVIGLDLAKQIFHFVGLDSNGNRVLRKKLRRTELKVYFANINSCLVVMEGCASSHYWARELKALGHQVKVLPAHHVKPYVRGNKNDYNDALAIAEASRVPEIRAVTVKTVKQQSIQALHRMRRAAVGDRTALSNQVRGLLSEFGIVFNKGVGILRKRLPEILEDGENGLYFQFRDALALKYQQLCQLDDLIKSLTDKIKAEAKENPEIQLIQSVPGFGPIVATNFHSVYGNCQAFKKGRDLSASLGIVPRQHSSGGKNTLLGISKRGDKYLRSLLIHGARSVVNSSANKSDPLSRWINQLVERRGKNKATVALANKLARIAWAVSVTGKPYESEFSISH